MPSELDISVLSEIAETAHCKAMCMHTELLDDLGTEAMFQIVIETTFDALAVEGNLGAINDVIDSGERVPAEEWESLANNLLYYLARLCAGEYLLHSRTPDIMNLSQATILLWPGQPLQNFGNPHPVLEGAYWYLHSNREYCTREIAHFGQFIKGGSDVPKKLAAGFNRLVDKIPEVITKITPISDEEYNKSELALARLQDLYKAKHRSPVKAIRQDNIYLPSPEHTVPSLEDTANEIKQPPSIRAQGTDEKYKIRLNAYEKKIIKALNEFGERLTTEPLLQKAFSKVNSHGKGTLASLVKRNILDNTDDARGKGYGLPSWSGPQSGP